MQETNTPLPITTESFGEVPDYFEPQSGRYLVRNSSLRWVPLNENCYKRQLRARAFKAKPNDGDLLSEIDAAILDVQDLRDVSHYGPICGQNSGLLHVNGQRILVTEDMKLPQPAPGDWSNLRAVLDGLLRLSETERAGRIQVETFHGWVKSSVEALRASRPKPSGAPSGTL